MIAYKHDDLIKVLEKMGVHLDEMQGNELKKRLDLAKQPKEISPLDKADVSPKGIAVEKVSVLAKPKAGFDDKVDQAISDQDKNPLASKDSPLSDSASEPEMSQEELEEMLDKLLSKKA